MKSASRDQLPAIEQLLVESNLPTDDLSELDLSLFITTGAENSVDAVGGIEPFGRVALIRSIATARHLRGCGIGRQIVRALEALAASHGIEVLYLLTESAEAYFKTLGYTKLQRSDVPQTIRESRQFSSLCSGSATVMFKQVHLDIK